MAKKKARRIPEPHEVPTNQRIVRFSFKHLDSNNARFHCSNCTAEYFRKLLETLQRYSTWTVEQFTEQSHEDHRHTLYFPETSEPNGFQGIPNADSDQFGYQDGWEIGIINQEEPWRANVWRAHGILIDDTFFIVWLDPNHALFTVATPN
jgi:hypothetical protein